MYEINWTLKPWVTDSREEGQFEIQDRGESNEKRLNYSSKALMVIPILKKNTIKG